MVKKPTYEELEQRVLDLEKAESDLKRAREQEAHIRNVLMAIRSVNQILVNETDPEQMVKGVCERLIETRGYYNAWIALMDEDSSSVTTTAVSGFGNGFDSMRSRLVLGEFPSCMRKALDEDRVMVTQNPAEQCYDCPLSSDYAGRSGLSHRLSYRGKIFGILSVSVPSAYAYERDEHDLFSELANDLGFALSKLKTDAQSHRLQQIVTSIPQPISFVSQNYRYLAVNDVYAELFGICAEKIIGQKQSDFFGEQVFHEQIKPQLDQTLHGKVSRYEIQTDFPGVGKRWMSMSYFPYRNEDGDITGVISHGYDITDRRLTEDALREKTKLLENISKNMFDLVSLTDLEGNFKFVGTSHKILGYDLDFLSGRNVLEFVHPEDLPEISSEFGEFLSQLDDNRTVEYRYRCADGTYLWFETVGKFIRDDNGNPKEILFSTREITERKRAEDALRRNEKDLRESQRIAHVGSWRLDVATNQVVWTEELYNMYGFDPSLPPPPYTEHMKLFTPESWQRLSTALARTRETRDPYTLELETVRKDGSNGWMWVRGEAEVDSAGKTVELWGAAQDITEHKQTEEALHQRLGYEQLLNAVSTIALVADDLGELQDRCLTLIGERLDADRVYFFRHDKATDTMDNTHEWCAEGIAPQKDKLQGMPGSAFSWWLQTMQRNEIICYPDIEEIPDEATKEILRSQDIKSILVVPLFINGQYCGFLGLDNCARHREWRQEDVEIFLSLSRIVAMATERWQAKKRLQDERQQFLSIFNGIEEAIYIADPVTHEVLFVNNFLNKILGGNLSGKKCHEQFQGLNVPCEFCTNQIILQNPGKVHRWEYYNSNLNRHYLLFDRVIKWTDGRDVRFEMAVDITERKIAEEALKNSEVSLKEAQRLAEIGSWSLDLRTGALSMSDQMYSIIGLEKTPEALDVATHEEHYTPESWHRFRSALETASKTGKSYEIEMEVVRDGGGNRHVVTCGEVVKDENGQTVALRGTLQDITERMTLQARLNQAQKMESVGRLAGGVAHDFNNMLGVILGHAEMALEQLAPTEPLHSDLEEIQKAARRSADITRQLLAFARKQTIAPKVIDLNEALNSALKMIKRLIGEDIVLVWMPGASLWPVKMDPSQIDQILANLCVNARDAISDVGKITIETGKASFDEAYCADHPGSVPGDFVLLAVSDDGCGMDKQTLANLFEPFFTTKDVGKGTGLGLATVYGIVKQNNGFVNVYSEPGQGTTFKIYLPSHAAKAVGESEKHPPQAMVRGSETILLVEDEPSILRMTRMMLERIGYKVLSAGSPGEAIALAREHAGEIHLLMTDVVMPEMNGRDLAGNLLSLYPNIKRLFMSGYTANVIAHHGVLEPGVQFIQKPFAKDKLATKVREALETS